MAPVISGVVAPSNTSLMTNTQHGLTQKLLARAPATTWTPCSGCIDPAKVNNKIYFSLFAIVGAAMVIASIWFFFHAKDGGFHWQQGDWDDYKSTVLRKRDANGNTIYTARSTITPPSTGDRIAAQSVVGYDKKGRKGVMAVRGFGGSHSVYYSDNFTVCPGDGSDAITSISRNEKPRKQTPNTGGGHASKQSPNMHGGHASNQSDHSRRYRDRALRDYKHEKPARVGGMNRAPDGTQYDYSDRSETLTETSSSAPILSSSDRKREKAERRAAEEAARMERKWRKEAERAAAALAREQPSTKASASKPPPTPKSHTPEKMIRSSKRGHGRSRSSSPRKQDNRATATRDYSFSGAPDDITTAYTGTSYAATTTTTTTNRTNSSYYDAYRPVAQASPQAAPGKKRERRPSSSSPSKHHRSSRFSYAESEAASSDRSGGRYERVGGGDGKKKGGSGGAGRDVMAGYRRGMDSLASDSE